MKNKIEEILAWIVMALIFVLASDFTFTFVNICVAMMFLIAMIKLIMFYTGIINTYHKIVMDDYRKLFWELNNSLLEYEAFIKDFSKYRLTDDDTRTMKKLFALRKRAYKLLKKAE